MVLAINRRISLLQQWWGIPRRRIQTGVIASHDSSLCPGDQGRRSNFFLSRRKGLWPTVESLSSFELNLKIKCPLSVREVR